MAATTQDSGSTRESQDALGRSYTFEDFELRAGSCELYRSGSLTDIQLTPTRLLVYLVENRDRVVLRTELLDAIWSDAIVGDSTLTTAIGEIRRVLRDTGDTQRFIQTRRGRGYRFVADVEERVQAQQGVPLFVGRGATLTALRQALEAAQGGRGQIVLLTGEPGIGKTSAAGELMQIARNRRVPTFMARCYEGDGAPPYWPWTQILRWLIEQRSTDTLQSEMGTRAADIALILPELRERLPSLPDPPELDAAEARFRLFESIAAFVRQVAGERSLALIIDDLHCADSASLRLMEFLAPQIAGTRTLLVGTYRDVAVQQGHPLMRTLSELARNDVCLRTRLEGLLPEEVHDLACALTGEEPSPAFIAEITERTDGNPLFVKLLLERDALVGQTTGESDAVPQGVREVLLGRRTTMSSDCNELLETASVMGRGFTPEVIEVALDLDDHTVDDLIHQAYQAGFVEERHGGDARFSHALVQEATYSELSRPRRAELHLRVGEALEKLYRNPEPHLSALAYHFSESVAVGGAEKAIDYATQAGRHATSQLAFEEAARHHEQALRVFEQTQTGQDKQRCALLLVLGQAQLDSGDYRACMETCECAASSAKGEPVLLATAAIRHSRALSIVLDPPDLTVQLLDEALGAVGSQDSRLRAQLLVELARSLERGSDERQLRVSLDAVEMARRVGDPSVLHRALSVRQTALWALSPRHHEERIKLCEELVDVAKENDLEHVDVFEASIDLAIDRGDVAAWDATTEAYLHFCEESRRPFTVAQGLTKRAAFLLFQGRFEECERSLDAMRAVGSQSLLNSTTMNLLLIRMRIFQGRAEEVVDAFPELVLGGRNWLLPSLCRELDREEEARDAFDKCAEDRFLNLPRGNTWLEIITSLGDVCASLDDVARAQELHDLLSPYAGRLVSSRYPCWADPPWHALGLLSTVLSRLDEAVEHFEDSLIWSRRIGGRPTTARTQYELARTLVLRDQAGDRERALALTGEALSIAEELGMKPLIERSEALQLRIQGVVPLSGRSTLRSKH